MFWIIVVDGVLAVFVTVAAVAVAVDLTASICDFKIGIACCRSVIEFHCVLITS